MTIRNTRIEDLEEVMRIYARAVSYMAETGNPNQWTVGYPSRDMISNDIVNGVSYVIEENGYIEGVFSYIEGLDSTYKTIVDGAWKSWGRYGTIHRLASAGRKREIARQCFLWCENQAGMHGCASLRADTHMDNKIMQHLLQQSGFLYCGVIHLANGAPRLAYERLLGQTFEKAQQTEQKGDGIGLGVASMVLGVISLLLFCSCINFVTALVAIVLGIIQIAKNKEKSFAIVGIVTAIVSFVLAFLMWGTVAVGMDKMGVDSYEKFFENGYGDYLYEDNYENDYEDNLDEYFYEEEENTKFL